MTEKDTRPLGVRCNNPLNLMGSAIPWDGMTGTHKNGAGEYVVFKTPVHGLRAAALDLTNDWMKGKKSVRALISEFAPTAHGNDVDAYCAAVVRGMASVGVTTDTEDLNLADIDTLVALMWAMARHELGRSPAVWYTTEQFREGARLALEKRRLAPVEAKQVGGGAAAGAGVAAALSQVPWEGIAAGAQEAMAQVQPYVDMFSWGKYVLLALACSAGTALLMKRVFEKVVRDAIANAKIEGAGE